MVGVVLKKGGNIVLSKDNVALTQIRVGLGWNARSTDGVEFDLDASAFLLNKNGKVRFDGDFVFYNQVRSSCGAVEHGGDNRTGDGDGDDEVIDVDLSKLSPMIESVAVCVTIHDAQARRQNFGQVEGAYIRIENKLDGQEVARFDLSEDASMETAMIFGELYRNGGAWKFRAVGQGWKGGLEAMCGKYGVAVAG